MPEVHADTGQSALASWHKYYCDSGCLLAQTAEFLRQKLESFQCCGGRCGKLTAWLLMMMPVLPVFDEQPVVHKHHKYS